MIITLRKDTPTKEIDKLKTFVARFGVSPCIINTENCILIYLIGDTTAISERDIRASEWVETVQRLQNPYRLASRLFHPEDTIVDVDGVKVGNREKIAVIAGPCAVESLDSICKIAKEVQAAGASLLRGGAFKPRTSPYSFQGLGVQGIDDLLIAKEKSGLPIVSELMSTEQLDLFAEKVDLIQIGARNMQNYELLKALGHINKPVLLKRGLSATIEEWIMSAEYIMAAGNPNIIFCERGVRCFEPLTRNMMDLSVIPIIKEKTHLPIIVDPSHATGKWKLIEPVALAAIAAGADGLMIEVHDEPESALSDGVQSLKPAKFAELMEKGRQVAAAIGRDL